MHLISIKIYLLLIEIQKSKYPKLSTINILERLITMKNATTYFYREQNLGRMREAEQIQIRLPDASC